jgi:sulfhydrogenase subunit delta
MTRPKIGIYGLTGCAGDQLNILNCEDALLELFDIFEFPSFVMASSAHDESVKLDIAFVEGSVSTEKDLEDLKKIRKKSNILVAIGHCAVNGGVQSMFMGDDRWIDRYAKVYGHKSAVKLTRPLVPQSVVSTVKVDAVLPGCPIEKEPFLHIAGLLSQGIIPRTPDYPVCAVCRWKENECLLLRGDLCLGPLTTAGCGAICPSFSVPCIGCWGPIEEENIDSEALLLIANKHSIESVVKRMAVFGGTDRTGSLKTMHEMLRGKIAEQKK